VSGEKQSTAMTRIAQAVGHPQRAQKRSYAHGRPQPRQPLRLMIQNVAGEDRQEDQEWQAAEADHRGDAEQSLHAGPPADVADAGDQPPPPLAPVDTGARAT